MSDENIVRNKLNVSVNETSSIPFKIEEPNPSKELKSALKEVNYMMRHPEKYKSYSSVDELFEDLDNDVA